MFLKTVILSSMLVSNTALAYTTYKVECLPSTDSVCMLELNTKTLVVKAKDLPHYIPFFDNRQSPILERCQLQFCRDEHGQVLGLNRKYRLFRNR